MPPPRPTGRPATWCSDRCKRAAYEERRAAANGAIAVKVIEKIVVQDAHHLHECTNRVMESPVACRRVFDHLAALGAWVSNTPLGLPGERTGSGDNLVCQTMSAQRACSR